MNLPKSKYFIIFKTLYTAFVMENYISAIKSENDNVSFFLTI